MDDPKLHFSGESKDWSRFKQDIQSRADRYDTTWLFEGGRQWALFLARQIKDKTGTAAAKKKALERELNPKDDSNYVPTSCDNYTMRTSSRTRCLRNTSSVCVCVCVCVCVDVTCDVTIDTGGERNSV